MSHHHLWLSRQKKKAEFEMYLRRMMNRYRKDLLIDTHKVNTPAYAFVVSIPPPSLCGLLREILFVLRQVHLMCLLASGMFRNRLCSEPDLLAITLSMLPAHFSAVAKERKDQNYLSGLLKWYVHVRNTPWSYCAFLS